MQYLRYPSLCTVAALAVATPPCYAGIMQTLDLRPWHLAHAEDERAVAALSFGIDEFSRYCSGTMINDQWMLTAAHCVVGLDSFNIDFDGHVVSAAEWYVPQQYTGFVIDRADIALVKLSRPIDLAAAGITPKVWNGQMQSNGERRTIEWDGKEIKIVGYGNIGEDWAGQIVGTAGTRHAGYNLAEKDTGNILGTYPGFISVDFDTDPGHDLFNDEYRQILEDLQTGDYDWDTVKPHPLEYQIAQGDSGGPDLIGDTIVGVHSWGYAPFWAGLPTYSTEVSQWAAWIEAVLAGNTTGAGGVPPSDAGSPGNPITVSLLDLQAAAADFQAYLADSGKLDELRAAGILGPDETLEPGEYGFYVGPGTFDPDVWKDIPEPTTLAMLGIAGLPMLLRRRG